MAEPSPEGTEQQWLHSNLSVEIVSGEDLVAKDTKGMFSSQGEGLWPPRVYAPPSVSALPGCWTTKPATLPSQQLCRATLSSSSS